MSDLVQNAANVAVGSGAVAQTIRAVSGAAVVAGQPVYLDVAKQTWSPATASGNQQQAGQYGCGIALDSAPGANQYFTILLAGQINLGATLTAGVAYVVSANSGNIAPYTDLVVNNFVTVLGVAISTTILATFPSGVLVSNAQKPPASILPARLWFKADAGTYQDISYSPATPANANGNPVGAWVDQSQNATVIVAATNATRATLNTNVLNTLPVVHTSTGGLSTLGVGRFPLGVYTLFVVFRSSSAVQEEIVEILRLNNESSVFTTSNGWTLNEHRATPNVDGGWSLAAGWGNDNVWRIAVVQFDGTHAGNQLWLNGVLQTMTSQGDTTDPGAGEDTCDFYLGTNGVATMTGDFAEVLLYDSVLESADRLAVQAYLNTRWAVY